MIPEIRQVFPIPEGLRSWIFERTISRGEVIEDALPARLEDKFQMLGIFRNRPAKEMRI
jgi:hypothetical protein